MTMTATRATSAPLNMRALNNRPVSGDATSEAHPEYTPSAGDLWHAPRVFVGGSWVEVDRATKFAYRERNLVSGEFSTAEQFEGDRISELQAIRAIQSGRIV